MKKKSRIIIFIILSFVIIGGLYISKPVSANDQNLHSKGNMVLKEGTEFAFYADDIFYLQKEIDALFNEIN